MASFEPASSTGGQDERVAKPSSREALLQISRGICSEIPEKIVIRGIEKRYWEDIARFMSAARSGADRRIRDEGSYPYAADDTAEVQRGEHDWLFEREVGDPDFPGLPAGKAEFHRSSFLG